ncbi:protein MTSS 2-like isoform X2 [Argopecten irradians]|uniref:protein MTSS 2-like isoform X2 n=1 Tax=Argopecten irradians TaxID=31199 RepID=UPI003720232F
MECIDKDCTALGGLFQTIVNDMRGSTFIWEDFTSKAAKLHSSLKATLGAIGAFLDAFQKVADMATGSRGATKDIGSALTRLCIRHRTIESKLKGLTTSIIDNLVNPLQEKGEDWKKTVSQLDKEHAKEYKRARQEIKKAASDTMRLQKKAKKTTGKSDMQMKLDSAMQDVNDKYLLLEETEKNAVRTALIEERGRFCLFISCLRPFVEHEIGLLTEITHLQEIMDSLCYGASEPDKLPTASEQCINDIKGQDSSTWNFQQQSPPSSPSSLGSRKSSMCSINSINSSSSGSLKSHSPSHLTRNRNSVQHPQVGGVVRLTSVSSQDSGFTSQDTLFLRPTTPNSLSIRQKDVDSRSVGAETPEASTPSDNTPSASSTWTTWPNPPNPEGKSEAQRPHTISSAYEKSQKRPALSSKLFEPMLPEGEDQPSEPPVIRHERSNSTSSNSSNPYARPQSATINKLQPMLPPLAPKPKSRAVAPPKVPVAGEPQALYVNLTDLASDAEQQKDQGTDSDMTPTERSPPSTMHQQSLFRLNLEEAIRDLDSCTAALHTDYNPNSPASQNTEQQQIKQNSLELAEAIKELEASTAALQSSYDTSSTTSQNSLQCSSGYGTMNSTPSGSKDTIASGDYDLSTEQDYVPEIEKYYTIPRNSEMGNVYRQLQASRPASLAGIPVSQVARRASMNTPKPPPPVRRSSSISTAAAPPVVQRLRKTPPRDMADKSGQPVSAGHRRSSSSGGLAEPAYAELQTIQQSIQLRHQQEQQHHLQANPYATPGNQHITMSAPPTPSQHMPQPLPPGSVNNQRGHHPPPTGAPHSKKVGGTEAPTNPPPGIPGAGRRRQESTPPQYAPPDTDLDLPPPPTEWELEEIEKVYSAPPPVRPKPPPQGSNPENVRASLLSELKLGPKLRRVTSEDGSEC